MEHKSKNVFIVFANLKVLTNVRWIDAILSYEVSEQHRVVFWRCRVSGDVNSQQIGAPVHRTAASLAKVTARLFSSTLTGSHAP